MHLGVLFHRMVHVGDIGNVEVPQPVALRVHHVESVGEKTVARGVPHNFVAFTVDAHEFVVCHAWPTSILQVGSHCIPMLLLATCGSKSHGVRFQNRSCLVQHGKFHHVDSGNQHAASRDDGDELVACQPLQRLSDWCSANA